MPLRPHRFLVLLALLGLLLPACSGRRGGGRGGGGDDDDSVGDDDDDLFADDDDTSTTDDDDSTPPVDDDDSTPPVDDDDTTPPMDDDDTTPPMDDDDTTTGGNCSGAVPTIAEVEPNDDGASAQVISITSSGFLIQGHMEACGDGSSYGPSDFFAVTWGCDGPADVQETWTGGASDLDFYVNTDPSLSQASQVVSGIIEDNNGPENGSFTVTAGQPYWLAVACWNGAPADYELELTF